MTIYFLPYFLIISNIYYIYYSYIYIDLMRYVIKYFTLMIMYIYILRHHGAFKYHIFPLTYK